MNIILEALQAARATAMEQAWKARIPECGEFAAIAQNLDFVCAALSQLEPVAIIEETWPEKGSGWIGSTPPVGTKLYTSPIGESPSYTNKGTKYMPVPDMPVLDQIQTICSDNSRGDTEILAEIRAIAAKYTINIKKV